LGQDHISRTLQNAIEAQRLHHAYLFTGVRGVGKTTVARILAKALNCEKAPVTEPCNACKNCSDITNGSNMDVQEIDGASNTGVDDVREIRERLKYLPSQGKYKIYIIDEVHMLSTAAFNALLKTLEEPPSHVIFVFATTEPQKIPATILSRCQRHDFRRISVSVIADSVKKIADAEGIDIEPDAMIAISSEAEGSMRDAQSLFDQAVAFAGKNISYENLKEMLGFMDRTQLKSLVTALVDKDPVAALAIIEDVHNGSGNLVRLVQELLGMIRGLLVLSATSDQNFLKDVPGEDREFLGSAAGKRQLSEWEQMFRICYREASEITRSRYPKMVLEALTIQLTQVRPVESVDALIEKVDRLSKGVGKDPVTSRACHREAPDPAHTKPVEVERVNTISNPAARATIDEVEWKKFLLWLHGEKPQLSSILEHGIFVGGGNGSVNLQYSTGSIYGEMLRELHRKKQLEKFIEQHFGTKYLINFKMIDGDVSPIERKASEIVANKERSKKLKEETLEHEIVKGATAIFEADIKEIRIKENKE
jgi:DNA polymerase-3 subunit gamma/tau